MAIDFEFRIKQLTEHSSDATMLDGAFRTFAQARDHGIGLIRNGCAAAVEVLMHTLLDGKITEAHTIEVLRLENLRGRSDLGVGNECAG